MIEQKYDTDEDFKRRVKLGARGGGELHILRRFNNHAVTMQHNAKGHDTVKGAMHDRKCKNNKGHHLMTQHRTRAIVGQSLALLRRGRRGRQSDGHPACLCFTTGMYLCTD